MPGEILFGEGAIEINAGATRSSWRGQHRRPARSRSARTTTSPQANAALAFDRDAACGHRLDVPAGTSVRFEPGVAATVALVPLAGARKCTALSRGPARADWTPDERPVPGALRRAVRPDHRRPDPAGRHRPADRGHRGPQRRSGWPATRRSSAAAR